MIEKIVSGGQTGVDRGALDAALELNFPCGGWCPKGRIAEDGPIAKKYPLKETPSAEYIERTEWNVRDSDATLILTQGPPTYGTALTIEFANQHHKPCYVVDLLKKHSVKEIWDWSLKNKVKILNVAGPRISKKPKIEALTKALILSLLEFSPKN